MKPRTWRVGDRVRWKSQASGRRKDKIGEVVVIVPPNARPPNKFGYQVPRDHEWYIVRVNGRLYHPRAASLRPVQVPK